MKKNFIINCVVTDSFDRIMEGEGSGAGAGAGTGTGAGAGAGTGTGAGAGEGGNTPQTYTKEEVAKMIEQERTRGEEATRKTITELEKLKKDHGLTAQQKQSLETKITELNETLMSKEELARKEQEKLKNQYTTDITAAKQSAEAWERRYKESTIAREISDAAASSGAFDPDQIAAMIRGNARVVEVQDAEGNPTGEFQTKVKMPTLDKDKKPAILDITVQEAVKIMKDTPEKYGNLFKDTANNGVGGQGNTGSRGTMDPSQMTPEQYRKNFRKQVLNG